MSIDELSAHLFLRNLLGQILVVDGSFIVKTGQANITKQNQLSWFGSPLGDIIHCQNAL